jgi:hypothetical protein
VRFASHPARPKEVRHLFTVLSWGGERALALLH